MRWVYRLQQRVAITRSESNVILGLVFLCCLGLAARYVQRHARPLPDVDYTEAERVFEQASNAALTTPDEPVQSLSTAASAAPSMPAETTYPPEASSPVGLIDLNTASAGTLQQLPRIGPKIAARIVAYREAHGPFRRIQDLEQVRGIGAKTLARLKPYLVVEEP